MKIQFLIGIIFVAIGSWSCNDRPEKSANLHPFMKNIKFNHLYVVIDDTTYKYLFDSLRFFDDFSINSEDSISAGDESWTGKYLMGKHNYLEIFKPNGYEGAKMGDLGLGFMTNKIGTLDSLYSCWKANLDSVTIENKDFVNEIGDRTSWFRSISIPNTDSLQIDPWLMENTREHMISSGFTNNDLLSKIEFYDYMKIKTANHYGISPDSIIYNKLFDKVTSLHLTLSEKELNYLKQYLDDFGFTEKNGIFSKEDFEIKYSISESRHFILNQIDFSLLDSLESEKYSFSNLDLLVNGEKASLKLTYK